MKINFVSKTDNFFLKKPPEHVECNSHSHDVTFLSKYQKTFLQPWKTGKRAFLPKTGFLLKKLSGQLKCSFDKSAKQYFAKSAMAVAQNPEKDFGETYFSKKISIILENVP